MYFDQGFGTRLIWPSIAKCGRRQSLLKAWRSASHCSVDTNYLVLGPFKMQHRD